MKRRTTNAAVLTISLSLLMSCLLFMNSHASVPPNPAPKKVDLRSKIAGFNLPIKTQGGRNTCSVYATTFLLEYESAKASNQSGLDFSEEYLNAVTDIVKGVKDDGDFFDNVLAGYLSYGVVDETDFPNKETYSATNIPPQTLLSDGQKNIRFVPVFIRENPRTPNPWGLTDEHINQIIAQLDAGRPVAAGWRLARNGAIENTKVLGVDVWSKNIMKTPTDFVGHSMPIVGYVKGTAAEGGYFIIRNSGGSTWGDNGYWYCTFDYAKQNIADVFYLTAKPRNLNVQMPALIRTPVPRYIRVDELRSLPAFKAPKPNVIILQKKG